MDQKNTKNQFKILEISLEHHISVNTSSKEISIVLYVSVAHISMEFMFGLPFSTIFATGFATALIILVLLYWGLTFKEEEE